MVDDVIIIPLYTEVSIPAWLSRGSIYQVIINNAGGNVESINNTISCTHFRMLTLNVKLTELISNTFAVSRTLTLNVKLTELISNPFAVSKSNLFFTFTQVY